MESWQKDHISHHISELVNNTLCNAKLLQKLQASGELGRVDVETIESKGCALDQAKELYKIAGTRRNAYTALLKALSSCQQTVSLQILLNGFPIASILNAKVNFLGQVQRVNSLLDEADIQEIATGLGGSISVEQYIETFLSRDITKDVILLVKNTIPTKDQIYLDRYLSKRIKLKQEIFRVDSTDVFVFRRSRRRDLTELADQAKHRTASSRHQLTELTARFILLENDDHWNEICTLARRIPVSVHLIKCDPDTKAFILEKTTGGSKILNHYLMYQEDSKNDLAVHENSVLEKATNESDSGFCICDMPGMGKSLLLANLARNVEKQHQAGLSKWFTIRKQPETRKIVSFVQLSPLSQYLKTITSKRTKDIRWAMEAVIHFVSPTPLSKQILLRMISKANIQVEFFFDGFDEVAQENVSLVQTLLQILVKENSTVKIHVTSRPHMRQELEATLKLIPYDILPFDHDAKVRFLTTFWKQQNPKCDTSKLVEFANFCLQKWKGTIVEKDLQVTGISMQCRLLAEVQSKYAEIYGTSSQPLLLEQIVFETCLCQWYHKFAENGWKHLEDSLSSSETSTLTKVRRFHVWKSLQLLFPETAVMYQQHYSINTKDDENPQNFLPGMLKSHYDGTETCVDFIHRTFAEYLAAEYFSAFLLNKKEKDRPDADESYDKLAFRNLMKSVFNTEKIQELPIYVNRWYSVKLPMYTFSELVVMAFINGKVQELQALDSSSPISHIISVEELFSILVASLYNNFCNVLRLIKYWILRAPQGEQEALKLYLSEKYEKKWEITRAQGLLYVAAENTRLETLQVLHGILQDIQFDVNSLYNVIPLTYHTPLNLALNDDEYDKVEYILQSFTNIKGRNLLHYVVRYSNEEFEEVVQIKIAICQLLLSREEGIIHEDGDMKMHKIWTNGNILTVDRIHVKLIKFLIYQGANMHARNRFGENIVTVACRYMSAKDFHELVRLLIEEYNAVALFGSAESAESPLHDACLWCRDMSVATLKLALGVNKEAIHLLGSLENTLIQRAVAGHQSVELVMEMIERGADTQARNGDGWNALHVAAACKNVEMIYYLLNRGLLMSEKVEDGNTPLHLLLLDSGKMEELLGRMMLDSRIKDKRMPNETIEKFVISILNNQFDDTIWQLFTTKNSRGQTPLYSYLEGDVEMSEGTLEIILKNAQVDPNETDLEGNNLILAAIRGRKSEGTLKTLIDYGVDYQGANKQGQDVFDVAAESKNIKALSFFLALGLNIRQDDAVQANGATP